MGWPCTAPCCFRTILYFITYFDNFISSCLHTTLILKIHTSTGVSIVFGSKIHWSVGRNSYSWCSFFVLSRYCPITCMSFCLWEAKILLVGWGWSVSAGPFPSFMEKWISCDRNVRKVPNFTPLRHNSYTALNGFSYERRRGSPTQSSAWNKIGCGSARLTEWQPSAKVFTYYQKKKEEEGWWEQNIWKSRSSWSNNF